MKKLLVANWKMNLSYRAGLALAQKYSLSRRLKRSACEVVICPDYLVLPETSRIFKRSSLKIGAQDCAASTRGAHTGEVSPSDLRAVGARYAIIGHSERREHLHENSAIIAAKIRAALSERLIPIICIGEKLIERENGETRKYLNWELRRLLSGLKLSRTEDLIIAYEPVWAISTAPQAKAVSAVEAESVHAHIKNQAARLLRKNIRVIYGGSVNTLNAAGFLAQPSIDGLLVGAASLKLADLEAMC